jgi:hypothetical protein
MRIGCRTAVEHHSGGCQIFHRGYYGLDTPLIGRQHFDAVAKVLDRHRSG